MPYWWPEYGQILGPKLWIVFTMLLLGLEIACLCGLLWLVTRTVLWASFMPQLVLITELSFLTFD